MLNTHRKLFPYSYLLLFFTTVIFTGCGGEEIEFDVMIGDQVQPFELIAAEEGGEPIAHYEITAGTRFLLKDLTVIKNAQRLWLKNGESTDNDRSTYNTSLMGNGEQYIELCYTDKTGETNCLKKIFKVTGDDFPYDGGDLFDPVVEEDDFFEEDPVVEPEEPRGITYTQADDGEVASAEVAIRSARQPREVKPSSQRETSGETLPRVEPEETTQPTRRPTVERQPEVTRQPSSAPSYPTSEPAPTIKPEPEPEPAPSPAPVRSTVTPTPVSPERTSPAPEPRPTSVPEPVREPAPEPAPTPERIPDPAPSTSKPAPTPEPPVTPILKPLNSRRTAGISLKELSDGCAAFTDGRVVLTIDVKEPIEIRGFSVNTDVCGKLRITLSGNGMNESVSKRVSGGPVALNISQLGWRLEAGQSYSLTIVPAKDSSCGEALPPKLAKAENCGLEERIRSQVDLAYQNGKAIYDFRYYY